MTNITVSRRLQTIANFIPDQSAIADIGSDHAYLPCFAYQQNLIKCAVAGELNDGPLNSAKKQVESLGLAHVIDVRKGNGLEVIQPEEVNTIIIAGMGGSLIRDILNEGHATLTSNMRLILQPNIAAISIRDWLVLHNWKVIDEEIIEEDDKIYEIIVAERSEEPVILSDSERLLGPILMVKKNNVFVKKWQQEYQKWEEVHHAITGAKQTPETTRKKQEFSTKMALVKEALS